MGKELHSELHPVRFTYKEMGLIKHIMHEFSDYFEEEADAFFKTIKKSEEGLDLYEQKKYTTGVQLSLGEHAVWVRKAESSNLSTPKETNKGEKMGEKVYITKYNEILKRIRGLKIVDIKQKEVKCNLDNAILALPDGSELHVVIPQHKA